MKSQIPFLQTKMGWLAVGLMALQLVIKLTLEIGKALETNNLLVSSVAILFTIGWVVIITLCIFGQRVGYWLGATWGLLHFVMTMAVPMAGICDHYLFASIVAAHGILISAACMLVIFNDDKQRKLGDMLKMSKNFAAGYVLLCVSSLARTLWITFREPTGALRAQTALAGKGGLPELAASTTLAVVVLSMVILCAIWPGIVLRKRWAFISAAIFGGLHVVLTFANVILHVNQGLGPWVVIPASFGMLLGGIWMASQNSNQELEHGKQVGLSGAVD